ncbi:hypothetical protein AB0K23_24625 [Streptomyces sp. NPDC049602]|uniref:hypothetical protein n=1 Tax=Streptomyces sp. NPDC049602 TaxID=3155504 RepID=UPI00342C6BA6
MDEIGRAEWFAIGVLGMTLAGAAHATIGATHVAREMLRAPAGNPGTSGSDFQVDSGRGGWILIGALVLAGGSIYHFVSGVGTIVKEIVHVEER